MDEDIQNLQLDKPSRGKGAEAMKRHTLDDQFENKPIERSMHLLTKGEDVQRFSVIQSLPQLIKSEPQGTNSRIIPKILQDLPNASCEFHIVTSKAFNMLALEKLATPVVLHAVLQGVESKDPIIVSCWTEALLGIIGVLTEEQIKNEIIPLVLTKCAFNQSMSPRIVGCKLLGKIVSHRSLTSADVKTRLLPTVESLCQDCHSELRMHMCIQLPGVISALGPNFPDTNLLANLVELVSDENVNVRCAAITTVVQIFSYLDLECKKTTIFPLVRKFCEHCLKNDDITMTVVTHDFGLLMEGLEPVLQPSDLLWFLQCYRTLSKRGLSKEPYMKTIDVSKAVMCREHCAANLPKMTRITLELLPNESQLLSEIIKDLAADPCYMVRCTVAGSYCDIVKFFGEKAQVLLSDFLHLLKDDSEEVLQMVVPQLGETLMLFYAYGVLTRRPGCSATIDVGRAMVKCHYELNNGLNWRLKATFLVQLEQLPYCMSNEFIHQNFTPLVLNCILSGRTKPVRMQAARTLLFFLRYNNKEMQRRWLRDKIVQQLCYSESSYTRHVFINLCIDAMEIFSKHYFKDFFYENLLDLTDDPVPNIRLCVASLFYRLQKMLIMPNDNFLCTRLKDIYDRYDKFEQDRDVVRAFRKQMDYIAEKGTKVLSAEEKAAQDRADKCKFEEEVKINAGAVIERPTEQQQQQTAPKRKSLNQQDAVRGTKTAGAVPVTQSILQRSASRNPSVATTGSSGVTNPSFLEQHFYIDAGINFPAATYAHEDVVDDIEQCSNDENITDDEKVVKLRRQKMESSESSSSKSTIKNQHSSVITKECYQIYKIKKSSSVSTMMADHHHIERRRSLGHEIGSGTTSRIPKSCDRRKSFASINDNSNGSNKENDRGRGDTNGTIRLASMRSRGVSNLPVLKRQSTATDPKK